jgi:hypothetical protein
LKFIDYTSKLTADINLRANMSSQNTLFAIGLTGYNLAANKDMFKITAAQTVRFSNGSRLRPPALEFEPCRREEWAALGKSFEEYFDSNAMSGYICPKDYSFYLEGQFGTEIFSYLKIAIEPCTTGCKANLKTEIEARTKSAGGFL